VPLERVSQGFKDVSMSFLSNTLNDDLIALKNEQAIARSIRNIVFTFPGEKFFDESFGSEVSRSLFENIDDLSAETMRDQIEESINRFEPRVNLKKVKVLPDFDNNAYEAIVIYNIVGIDVPAQELEFVLQATR